MTITEAKAIADAPVGRDMDLIHMALKRLEATQSNGGVRNSERAMERLARRLDNLRSIIRQMSA